MIITKDSIKTKTRAQLAAYFNSLVIQLAAPAYKRADLLAQLAAVIAERARRGPSADL